MLYSKMKMRLTVEHHEMIVSFAEANPEIITNKFTGLNARENLGKLWENLVEDLNALGYGVLSVAEYKRRITDWKSKTKGKAVDINTNITRTGGGEGYHSGLSKIEQRLLALMGNKAYEGDSVKELGFKRTVDIPSRSRSAVVNSPLFGQDHMLRGKRVRICEEKSSLVSKLLPSSSFAIYKDSPKKKMETSQTDKPTTVTSGAFIGCSTKPITYRYEPENVFEDAYTEDIIVKVVEENKKENTENVDPSTGYLSDHQYHKTEETKKRSETRTPSASTARRRNLSHMSESIQEMNNETLDVLKSIDKNLEGVKDNLTGINHSLKSISCVLTKKFL